MHFESAYPGPNVQQAIADGSWLVSNLTNDAEDLACKVKASETVLCFARSMVLPCPNEHVPRSAGAEAEKMATDLVACYTAAGYAVPTEEGGARAFGGIWLTLAKLAARVIMEWMANADGLNKPKSEKSDVQKSAEEGFHGKK
jgi:hypothetical protein